MVKLHDCCVMDFSKDGCRLLTSLSQKSRGLQWNYPTLANANVAKTMNKHKDRCVLDLASAAFYLSTSLAKCTHAMKYVWMPWLVLPIIGQRRLPKVHDPWQMVLVVWRHRCHESNAHSTWVMCACLWWCCMSLLKITSQIHPNHVICVKTLFYAACRWPMSPSRCM